MNRENVKERIHRPHDRNITIKATIQHYSTKQWPYGM